jgi:hypothetical protein
VSADIPEREDRPCPWCGRLTRFERDLGHGKSAIMHVRPVCESFDRWMRTNGRADITREFGVIYDPITGTYREVKGEA